MAHIDELARRVLNTRAKMVAAHASRLAVLRPSYGSRVVPVAGGQLVLSGPGMYVNRLVGAGLDRPITIDDIEVVEQQSNEVGVRSMIEVTPQTDQTIVGLLVDKGYQPDNSATTFTATPLTERPQTPKWLRVLPQPAADAPDHSAWLAAWQRTSALGFGLVDDDARRVNDDFVVAAAQLDGDGLLLVEDRAGGVPIATATVNILDGLGMLGAMSTIPEFRRRGVQAAMLAYRRHRAAERGCDLVVATAITGGDSERNLTRHGLTPLTSIVTWAAPVHKS